MPDHTFPIGNLLHTEMVGFPPEFLDAVLEPMEWPT